MHKSLFLAVASAAISLGVSAAHAQLLYSFEPGDSPNGKDGFVPNGLVPTEPPPAPPSVPMHLGLSTTAGGYTASYTQVPPAALSNPSLAGFTFDLTISANDPSFASGGGTYSILGMGFYIENAGESEYGDQYISPESDWVNIDLAPGTYTSLYVPLTGNDPDTGF